MPRPLRSETCGAAKLARRNAARAAVRELPLVRFVHASFTMTLTGDTGAALYVLPAAAYKSNDSLHITLDGMRIPHTIRTNQHGSREAVFDASAGKLEVEVRSRVEGSVSAAEAGETAQYLGDSRYVEASALRDVVDERFGGASGDFGTIEAMRAWVHRSLTYSPSLSGPDDSAVSTLEKRGGMCRDYAHLMIGLARAAGIPARYVGVYAPELRPSDFHAVAEVFLEGDWWVVDATGLAPRQSLIRVATGADAQDAAWATTTGAPLTLETLSVAASDDALPAGTVDDPAARIRIS